jgi:hypothetical protein
MTSRALKLAPEQLTDMVLFVDHAAKQPGSFQG